MNAVMGKILWVDLTLGKIHEEQIPPEVYEQFLSGLGLAAWLLYQRIPAKADPLGPENVLGFVSGLLTGTGSLMTGRWMAVGKSPLTGTWGDANCGGTLAPAIKQCGYDGIFFSGISPKPVYLRVDHGKAELCDAASLWGKDTRATEDLLGGGETGRLRSVACIGPAGEKVSLIAAISNDGGRMAARSGLGAVMGAKRLKAVVLSGAYPIPVAQPDEMRRLTEKFLKFVSFQPKFINGKGMQLLGSVMRWMPLQMRQNGLLYKILLTKWGTVAMNQTSVEMGDAPIRNWGGSNVDYNPRVSASMNPDLILAREQVKYHCYSCPVGCGGLIEHHGVQTHKPEYETVLAFGGLMMNQDLDAIFTANEMCNLAGIDTISAGSTLAFAIECYQQGMLNQEDLGGLELKWGDPAAVLRLLEMLIAREGIGDLLADGVRLAARRIGQRAAELSVDAGGQELAMHDGRNDPGFALHAAVEPTPGRHTSGSYLYYEMFQLWCKLKGLPPVRWMFYPKGGKYRADREKAVWGAACSQFTQVVNGAGLCLFGAFLGVHKLPVFEWLNAATGWEKTPEDYMRIGNNIQLVRQAFNARDGLELRRPVNARMLGTPPQKRGANRGRSVDLDTLVPLYWAEMGWNTENGRPLPGALAALGLAEPETGGK